MTTAAGAAPGASGGQSAGPAGGVAPDAKQAVPPVKRPGGAPAGAGPIVEHKGTTPDAKAGGAPGAHSGSADPKATKPGTPPAKPAPAAKAENPDWWKKIDLQVGKGEVETLEFSSAEEAQAWMRRERAQNRAWQQKHTTIEQRARALEAAGKDPAAAMKVLNPDFDPQAWAIEQARAAYEAEQAKLADPQGWEIQQRDQKIAEYEAEKTQRRNAELAEADKHAREASRKRWQERIASAIDELAVEEGGQPEDSDYKATVLLPAIAGVMFHARQANPSTLPSGEANPNYDPDLELTPKEVAREVRRLHGRTFERGLARVSADKVMPIVTKHLDGLDDAGLLAKLGPERVARIVKAHLESTNPLNTPRAQPPAHGDERTEDHEARTNGRMSAVGERKIPRL